MEFNERYIFDTTSDLLAEGPHARVYKAFDKLLQRDICLKVFSKDFAAGSPVIQQLNRAGIFFHPNICAFYDLIEVSATNIFGEKEIQPVGIFEYNNCGNITTFLKNSREPELIKKLIKDVLKGLSYLHSLENPHLDLKPNNILIKKVVATPVAKITDFLNSVNIKTERAYSETTSAALAYKAPEHFTSHQALLDYRADIWSLGTIVFEIITGNSLFHKVTDTTETTIKNILMADYKHKIAGLPEPFKTFVAKCLVRDVNSRNVSLEELSTILDESEKSIKPNIIQAVTSISAVENTIIAPTILLREGEPEKVIPTPIETQPQESKKEEQKKTIVIPLITAASIKEPISEKVTATASATLGVGNIATLLLLSTALLLCIGVGTYTYLNSNEKETAPERISEKITIPNTVAVPKEIPSNKKEADEQKQKEIPEIVNSQPIEIVKPPIQYQVAAPSIVTNTEVEPIVPKLPDYGTLYADKNYNFNLSLPSLGKEYTLWANHATVKEIGLNNFTLVPNTIDPITVMVLDKKDRTKITEKTYLVRAKPLLVATLGDDINGGYASAQMIISKLSMQVKADGKPMKVKSFRLTCASGTCSVTESQDGFFNSSIIQFLRKTKAGEKIHFDNIRAIDQEGEEYQVKDFSVTLTDSFIH